MAYWESLEDRFQSVIVPQMLGLLGPLLDGQIMPVLLRDPGCSLVLLPSNPLHSLPLEAYPGLESLTSVSRDFSLHMLTQRYAWMTAQSAERFAIPTNLTYILDPFNENAQVRDGGCLERTAWSLRQPKKGPVGRVLNAAAGPQPNAVG